MDTNFIEISIFLCPSCDRYHDAVGGLENRCIFIKATMMLYAMFVKMLQVNLLINEDFKGCI
jgi:hypothetical protein